MLIFILITVILQSSCATLSTNLSGYTNRVQSNVPAQVLVDGRYIGVTPLNFKLNGNGPLFRELTVRKLGLDSTTLILRRKFNPTVIFNFVLYGSFVGNLIGILATLVDYNTGNFWEYENLPIDVHLGEERSLLSKSESVEL